MTVRKIVAKSTKSLHPAADVTNFKDPYVKKAAQDLLDTLAAEQTELDKLHPNMGRGVGLASNQIEYPEPDYPKDFVPPNMYAVSIRSSRTRLEGCEIVEPTVYVNARYEVLPGNTQTSYGEGCLSLNGIQGTAVARDTVIKVFAQDIKGNELVIEARDFVARVHQHEQDHCRGQEYLNHLGFNHSNLNDIQIWIEANRNEPTPAPSTLITTHLICTGDPVDFDALSAWVEGMTERHEHRI